MGLFKGKKDGDDDSNTRSALFGSRSKTDKSPNAASQNPYANLPTQADAYNAAKARAGVPGYEKQRQPGGGPAGGDRYGGYGGGPPPPGQERYGAPPPQPPTQGRGGGYPDDKKGGYGGMNGYPDDKKSSGGGGYGADRYGAQGGYGADRYGSGRNNGGANDGAPAPPSKLGAGGYGGLGRASGAGGGADDDGRDALFGGAKNRVQKQTTDQQQHMGYGGPPPAYEDGDEFNTGRDPNEPQYEPYGDRQLTAEEEEEEDVTATKQQIRFIKQEDVSSTRNALRIAAQAEETGMNTLARIGAQGERIHNTEKNLDLTSNHNRMAEDKAKELKTLNRSMFAVHVSNPFTAGSRAEKRDNDVLERHHLEREQREATRRQGYETSQRMEKNFKDLSNPNSNDTSADKKQARLAERARFQFEADSEDEAMENEIDSNLNALGGAAARLNGLARATGKEVDEQNRHLERINATSSRVDDEIAMNRARLDRFK